MTPSTTILGEHLEPAARPAAPRARARGELLGYLALAALIVGAWQFSRLGLYTAQSDTGYWIGVVGGVMMLLLFGYPLRKRWQALARLGQAKHWFIVHMVLGILGPVLVLSHATFRIGSLNAGVALFSMLVVAASGVVGRFIYLRIHKGLGGERLNFEALRDSMGLSSHDVRSQLHFAPQAEARLRALDRLVRQPADSLLEHLRSLSVLPWLLARERRLCRHEVRRALSIVAQERGWDRDTRQGRLRRAHRLVGQYTASVARVAQFAAYTRLFSLWHVLHVPFVVVMVISAIVHVVAVHAY